MLSDLGSLVRSSRYGSMWKYLDDWVWKELLKFAALQHQQKRAQWTLGTSLAGGCRPQTSVIHSTACRLMRYSPLPPSAGGRRWLPHTAS